MVPRRQRSPDDPGTLGFRTHMAVAFGHALGEIPMAIDPLLERWAVSRGSWNNNTAIRPRAATRAICTLQLEQTGW